MVNYEFFYPGASYSLDSGYGNVFTGYRMPAQQIGMAVDPRTANQLKEVNSTLNMGGKTVEVQGTSAEVFESIPKQHLKEINRLSKLTGTETTLHAPIIDSAGYTKEGWSKLNREASERQMKQVIERAHELNPKGNIPVTFHSTAMLPSGEVRIKTKDGEVVKSLLVVEPRTGKIKEIKETEKFFPGERGEFNATKEMNKENEDIWTEQVGQINWYAMRGEDEIRNVIGQARKTLSAINKKNKTDISTDEFFKAYGRSKDEQELFKNLPLEIKETLGLAAEDQFRRLDHASIFLKDSYRNLRGLYNMVYKEANKEDRGKLDAYANYIAPMVENVDVSLEKDPAKLQEFGKAIEKGVKVLTTIKAPKIFKPLNDFLFDQSSQTFANAALHGYKKYGEKAPIVSIENPPAGGGLSRGSELKELVEKSREKFIEQAVKEGYSKSTATDASKKLIGVTWDVGHINMIRKYGYEKKDLIKEAGIIKPYLKHLHLSDNFGFEHTELPMGMGNVPIKEIMQKLGKEGYEAKKIIEAGNWWQHFSPGGKQNPPLGPTLEAFGSPLYSMQMGPYWNQTSNVYPGYSTGYGQFLPDQHFSMYGAGFESLPVELGGQVQGKQSRFSGTPNQ